MEVFGVALQRRDNFNVTFCHKYVHMQRLYQINQSIPVLMKLQPKVLPLMLCADIGLLSKIYLGPFFCSGAGCVLWATKDQMTTPRGAKLSKVQCRDDASWFGCVLNWLLLGTVFRVAFESGFLVSTKFKLSHTKEITYF